MKLGGAFVAAGVAGLCVSAALAQAQADPAPPRPAMGSPMHVDETGRTPDGPPTAEDLAYDGRLRSSAAAAQRFQGPMDGAWTLRSAGGRELYVFQLTDRNGLVEGAWRDPRRAGALDASGFIDAVERAGGDLTLRLPGGAVAVLHAADGRWRGELIDEGGRTERVVLSRRP